MNSINVSFLKSAKNVIKVSLTFKNYAQTLLIAFEIFFESEFLLLIFMKLLTKHLFFM